MGTFDNINVNSIAVMISRVKIPVRKKTTTDNNAAASHKAWYKIRKVFEKVVRLNHHLRGNLYDSRIFLSVMQETNFRSN